MNVFNLPKDKSKVKEFTNLDLSGWPGLHVMSESHGGVVSSEGGHPQATRGHVEWKVAVVYWTRENHFSLAQIADL